MKKLFIMLVLLLFSCAGELDVGGDSPVVTLASFPKNLSWGAIDTNNDGVLENYVTPIRNQPCSDCFIYAAVGALEIQYQIDHKITGMSLDLSEQNLHNCLRTSCMATGDPRFFLDHFKNYGALEERYVKQGRWGTCDNCKNYLYNYAIENIPFYRLKEWRIAVYPQMNYEDKRQALIAALQTGPVILYIGSWGGFKKSGDILYCTEFISGSHFVVAVGYRNYGEAFLIKNSHGEKGLVKIAFKNAYKCYFAKLAMQIVPGSTYISYGSGENLCYSTSDTDGDLIPDVHDNCPYKSNKDQQNSDGDMFGDACDPCPNKWDPNTGFYC